jgi:hypothetical protein
MAPFAGSTIWFISRKHLSRSVAVLGACFMAGPAFAQTVVSRVSVDAAGTQVAGGSSQPSASADGRYVAFASSAANLVSGDTNSSRDIFVKDRQTGAVTRVSVRTDQSQVVGDSATPDISPDGRFVTLVSAAALVPEDTNTCPGGQPAGPTCPDVYVHDRQTGATTRVSVGSGGVQADGASAGPQISGDGRYVVFESIAGNLVAGDTNQVADVFLHDRQTGATTRVSVSSQGVQSMLASGAPAINDDGAVVAFTSDSTTLDPTPDTLPCTPGVLTCTRVFLHAPATGATTRAPVTDPFGAGASIPTPRTFRVRRPALSADGRTLAVAMLMAASDYAAAGVAVFSSAVGSTRKLNFVSDPADWTPEPDLPFVLLSGNGRTVASCRRRVGTYLLDVSDAATGLSTVVGRRPGLDWGMPDCDGGALTHDGQIAFFGTSAEYLVSGDTNAALDVIAIDQDPDRDHMPSAWESVFGLDGNDGTDGAADADNDGLTNRQELEGGTHPRGLYKRYLAEGADNSFFSTYISALNTNNAPATVVARFLGENGVATTSSVRQLGAWGSGGSLAVFQSSGDPAAFPDQAFSTVVESDQPMAVERTQTWGGPRGSGYGSHAETGIANPSQTWFFAEGATHGNLDLYYLLQNPNTAPANVTITYLRPSPLPAITHTYAVGAHSRRTIRVNGEPELSEAEVSARIESNLPIFAERAMYLSTAAEPFAGGTSGAGIPAASTQWFVAEGATGDFMDMFILIGNPTSEDASVTVRYLLPDGNSFDKTYAVARLSRLSIGVDSEDGRLAAAAVSAVVTSTNGVPIVVERAMWWPSPNWYEGSVTAASTDTALRWALAEGFTSTNPGTETFLLVANPNDHPVTVTFNLGFYGYPAFPGCQPSVTVPARGRYSAGLKTLVCPDMLSYLRNEAVFTGVIESQGGPIVVERATYWSTPTQVWAAGASTLLTKLP